MVKRRHTTGAFDEKALKKMTERQAPPFGEGFLTVLLGKENPPGPLKRGNVADRFRRGEIKKRRILLFSFITKNLKL